MFEGILGHESIQTFLLRLAEKERIPHALLFAGPEGVGKRTLARSFAAHLLEAPFARLESGHPDFFSFAPEGKSGHHSIEEIRILTDRVYQAPFEAKRRVFLIEDAERMQPAAANALLKTLEEPLESSHLILLTSRPDDLLPTIHSRLMKILFHPLPKPLLIELLKRRSLSPDLAEWADGSIGKAIEIAEHPEIESARKLIFALLEKKSAYPEIALGIDQIERLLDSEDPLIKSRRIQHLLAMVAGFYRDLEKRPKNWDDLLEKVRLGLDRNLKFSSCLEFLLLS